MDFNTNNGAAQAAEIFHGKAEQLSLFNYFRHPKNPLTTQQVQEICQIPQSKLNKIRVKQFSEFKNFLILHKKNNCWLVIET